MRRNRYISPKPLSPASEIFCAFSWKFQLLFLSLQAMRTTKEYVDLISAHAGELRSQFGIRSLRLFGSVSRGEQTENSDVDVCVEMEPRLFLIVRLQRYLEELLMCPVDVIHMHPHINKYLLNDINRDGIYVIN
jgi:predicted nucleotidyltransferase